MSSSNVVELGYADSIDHLWRLTSLFFPSKIGGKPAWLDYARIPGFDQVKCRVCGDPCAFLLQVYAPLSIRDDCFHRMIYVFVCRKGECSMAAEAGENFVILRQQLPRVNDFFSDSPIDPDFFDFAHDQRITQLLGKVQLCEVCGIAGTSLCGQCKRVRYCSKVHQALHWKSGHKTMCSFVEGDMEVQLETPKSSFLFPIFEIVTEREKLTAMPREKERPEEERMKDYTAYIKEAGLPRSKKESADEDAEWDFESQSQSKQFKTFQRRVAQNPEQVLRYQRDGHPLLATSSKESALSIPKCDICQGARTFEFQLMPHLLAYLDVDAIGDSIDWATVAIFTCSQSCPNSTAHEYCVKQNFD